jgi:hypothetical protein
LYLDEGKEIEIDAVGMLRISERTLDVDAAIFPCFKDWQKAFSM